MVSEPAGSKNSLKDIIFTQGVARSEWFARVCWDLKQSGVEGYITVARS